jgi:adenine-specific DNA-methyltransferase
MQNTSEICPIATADNLGTQHFTNTPNKEELGQFFTPVDVAQYMASLLRLPSKDSIRILDPGSGTGVLAAAAIKDLVDRKNNLLKNITLDLYEIDLDLNEKLTNSMKHLKNWCKNKGISLNYKIHWEDFILVNGPRINGQTLFDRDSNYFDIVISNPPYFKISKDDPRAKLCDTIVHGQPNIYALFMAVSAAVLNTDGQFLFITPRSFASGPYFKTFRNFLLKNISLKKIHQFASRTDAFDRDQILQENVILHGIAGESKMTDEILISTSFGKSDLDGTKFLKTTFSKILVDSDQKIIALPSNEKDFDLLDTFKKWTNSIEKMELKISTGPVVPFRATQYLQDEKNSKSVPLLWIQHITNLTVKFPLDKFRKQQWFCNENKSKKLLIKNQNMILMRRFSPKEDFRRLSVAPFLKSQLQTELIGLENHLNYIYSPKGNFSEKKLLGLVGFLSSKAFDTYFRITNGNTQVSATEIKNVKLPNIEHIEEIGTLLKNVNGLDFSSIDTIVNEVLDL